jgi:hypothetical protein
MHDLTAEYIQEDLIQVEHAKRITEIGSEIAELEGKRIRRESKSILFRSVQHNEKQFKQTAKTRQMKETCPRFHRVIETTAIGLSNVEKVDFERRHGFCQRKTAVKNSARFLSTGTAQSKPFLVVKTGFDKNVVFDFVGSGLIVVKNVFVDKTCFDSVYNKDGPY